MVPEQMPQEPPVGRPQRKRRPTIYDIAEQVGLNPSTVSRALAKPGRVNAQTEARIRAVAEELGFQANPMARSLLTGKTGTYAIAGLGAKRVGCNRCATGFR